MRIDHVLPSGGQWHSGATYAGMISYARTAASSGRDTERETVFDSVAISKSGQGLHEAEQTVKSLQEYAGWGNFNIDFATDDQTGSLIISIIDRESGEVIRQIPPEEILTLRSHLQELLDDVFDETT